MYRRPCTAVVQFSFLIRKSMHSFPLLPFIYHERSSITAMVLLGRVKGIRRRRGLCIDECSLAPRSSAVRLFPPLFHQRTALSGAQCFLIAACEWRAVRCVLPQAPMNFKQPSWTNEPVDLDVGKGYRQAFVAGDVRLAQRRWGGCD
jgi:hypothetical protein